MPARLSLTRNTIRLGCWVCYIGLADRGCGTWGIVTEISRKRAIVTVHGMNGRGLLPEMIEAPITDLAEVDDPEPDSPAV
jgi:hypothetical protein